MTERNTSSERLSERDVDRLLQQFFLDEVPAEFRRNGVHDAPVTRAQPQLESLARTATPDSSRGLAGMLGILVSATCCLIVTMFVPSGPTEETGNETAAAIGSHPRNQPGSENSLPVEERELLPYTSTGNHEDDRKPDHTSVDPLGPELEIEIFPLRPDKPRE